jgi:N-acetylglucosamine kinase-like BadF-type ATPase
MAVVGVDIGATKTHFAIQRGNAELAENVLPTDCWRQRKWNEDARALVGLITQLTAGENPTVLVVGAHGCDDAARCVGFQRSLAALTGGAVLVVNDAELLVPAAGFDHGIGVIAGTGSIAVARLADHAMLVAGGWGWLLGDEGGAVGLVREAIRAVRSALDSGKSADPLIGTLQRSLGTDDPLQFGQKLLEAGGAAAIGTHVSAVFAALDQGSGLAQAVVRDGGAALAKLARQLIGRGATGGHIVAAGSVIVHQDSLLSSFRESLAIALPEWDVTLLSNAPVHGAIALGKRIAAGEELFGLTPEVPTSWMPATPSQPMLR